MSEQVFINSAEPRSSHPVRVARAMLQGLARSPYTAYRLALKDIKGNYARTTFGLFWDLADPLMFGIIFFFLVAAGILHPGEMAVPYALFVTYGMLLYLTFTESLLAALRLFRSARGLLSHVKLDPEALVLAVFLRMLFNSSFRILVLLVLTLCMVDTPELTPLERLFDFLQFLALYPILILAGMAIGLLLAPFNALFKDVERIVSLIILPLRFATPVFYTINSAVLLLCNPLAVFIVNLRDVGTHVGLHAPGALALWAAGFTILFCIGAYLFHLAVPILAERS